MSSSKPARIEFRPVTADDFPLLETWLNAPHWRAWWGEPETELGYIRAMVEGRDATRPFVFLVDGSATGYIQSWCVRDQLKEPWLSKAPWLKQVPPNSIGVDMGIGDASDLSKGVGSAVLKAFAGRLRAQGHENILIDPDITNTRAIRAYEKAGFAPLIVSRESSDHENAAVLIMKLAPSSTQTRSETAV
ncbi:GNAT family N-acetyltransferase [Hoeflea sp. YIM 152468]|uniref:GNAT family N-acetyltransferase n=1 Tax=Hoeflea sp. YIM 152468 TaxID=3031759 RepID=UPI0023DA3D26|nr:GNAT family N-acetyltransferase [Hoeflea sp. YIM 152468]MDF1610486.1 GNAT family N-acetyltransferase [Hoeflea sp. YIM 152468]